MARHVGALAGQVAAAARARDVVRVNVRTGRNGLRGRPDRAAVLDDAIAGGNRAQRNLVSAWDRLRSRHRRVAGANGLPALDRFERRGDVVLGADDDRHRHWLTPLARRPPPPAISGPVTNVAASDARYTAAPTSSSRRPKRPIGVRVRNSWPRGPFRISRLRSVSKTPGAIAFTVTPWRAHSTESARVRPATAA